MTPDQSQRVRKITWQDPQLSSRNPMTISGLEYLRNIKEGLVQPPPAAILLGYHIVEASFGVSVFELNPTEFHYNPFRSVHGGIISTLLDTAMTSAVLSTLPVGESCSTLEIKVNFVRAITEQTGPVRAEGRVVHRGRRIAITEGKLMAAENRLCAFAVGTCVVLQADQNG